MLCVVFFLIVSETQLKNISKIDIPEIESKVVNHTPEPESKSLLTNILLTTIRIYQNSFSLVQGDVCNFTPSCSHFGYEAIKYHGLIKGLLLTSDRLQRCHSGAWKYLNKYYTLKIDSLRGPKLYDPVERY